MTAVTHLSTTSSTTDGQTFVSGAFTPTLNDLLIVTIGASGTAEANTTLTDSQGLGFTRVTNAFRSGNSSLVTVFVANALAAAASMTVTFDTGVTDTATGCNIVVEHISGMTRTGASAIRQSAITSGGAAGGTPAATFASAALTGNPTIGLVGNADNPAGLTAPTGWTERADVGHATPASGLEVVSRDSGFTGTAVTWGSASTGAYGVIILELDSSAAPAAASGFASVEFYNGSAWIDISADVISETLKWGGGIRGSNPFDRAATPGTCDFELRNGTNSSGGLLGYYSPDHASLRSGWRIGAKIRITLDDGTDTLIWIYRVKSITPVPGQYGPRRVEVTALDYMEEFAKRKVSGLTIQTNKRGDELIAALVATMPTAPTATSYGTGAFTIPYAFHTEKDEETACLTVAQKISQSELSLIFVAPDATTGEVLTYEPHTTRQSNYTSAGTLTNTMQDLSIEHSADNIINKARATTYPVEVETTLSVLASIEETFPLEINESRTIFLPYLDPGTERRISGSGLINPVQGTDINAEITQGSSINDGNVALSTSVTAGANSILVELSHNGGVSAKIYVYQLQIRGYAVRTFDKVESVASDATSITTYGEQTVTYNMPYQNAVPFGQAVAAEIVRRYKDPLTQISSVTFITSSTTLQTYALTLTIGDRITITETVTGTSDPFYINAADYELLPRDRLRVTWELERAFNDARYFTVGDATYGLVGDIYGVGPL